MQVSEFEIPSTQNGIALEHLELAVHRVEDEVTVHVQVLSLFRRRESSDHGTGQENGGKKLEKHPDESCGVEAGGGRSGILGVVCSGA